MIFNRSNETLSHVKQMYAPFRNIFYANLLDRILISYLIKEYAQLSPSHQNLRIRRIKYHLFVKYKTLHFNG